MPITSTFSKTPTSQLLNRQAMKSSPRKTSTPVHGHTETPPPLPTGMYAVEPPPPAPPVGTETGDALGEGVPLTGPGPADGLGDADGEGDADGRGLGFGLGDGRGVGLANAGLIV